jgi:hypothetical protein
MLDAFPCLISVSVNRRAGLMEAESCRASPAYGGRKRLPNLFPISITISFIWKDKTKRPCTVSDHGGTNQKPHMVCCTGGSVRENPVYHILQHHPFSAVKRRVMHTPVLIKASAQFLTFCSAYNLEEARRVSSLWQGSSPAKTRVSSMPSCVHGPHLRRSTNCYKLSDSDKLNDRLYE